MGETEGEADGDLGAVFFNKPKTRVETINDIDGEVINLFRVIREQPEELAFQIEYTPYARDEYYETYYSQGSDLERARRFLTRCWQAIGAKTSDRTGWRSLISSNGPKPTADFRKLPIRIHNVAERLRRVQIECQPAEQILERYQRPEVLIYADPPYVLSTRSKRHYKHEMTEQDHESMLHCLKDHPGPVLLSGYEHDLYQDILGDWKKETMITAAEAGATRTETLWINPIAADQIYGLRLC